MPYISILGRRSDDSLMTDEETDAAAIAGRAKGVFRQCSIGWHSECSDLQGARCTCWCHDDADEFDNPDYPPGYQGEVLG